MAWRVPQAIAHDFLDKGSVFVVHIPIPGNMTPHSVFHFSDVFPPCCPYSNTSSAPHRTHDILTT